MHNGGALDNTAANNCYGTEWRAKAEHSTFAVHAHNAGYRTSYAGKYLNQYSGPTVPPGWSTWYGLQGNSIYYNYSLVIQDQEDGKGPPRIQHYKDNYATDYLPNVLTNFTIKTIHQFVQQKDDKPFLIVQGWPSPHAPFTPAPEDERAFLNKMAPRTPNYNATWSHMWNKHWMMRQLTALTNDDASQIDQIYQQRLETLLTVDRNIGDILKALDDTGVLDNTYIIFMSDNGFQLGQHRLPADKRQLYEHDIRIPLVVAGPGVSRGKISQDVVLNIDIAPTITELTALANDTTYKSILRGMDGQSFTSVLRDTLPTLSMNHQQRDETFHRDHFLVSYHGLLYNIFTTRDYPNNTYHCVRSIVMDTEETTSYNKNDIFCRFEDDEHFVEYYDMTKDEWQLSNAIDSLTDNEIWNFERRLAVLKSCHGESCRPKPRHAQL